MNIQIFDNQISYSSSTHSTNESNILPIPFIIVSFN